MGLTCSNLSYSSEKARWNQHEPISNILNGIRVLQPEQTKIENLGTSCDGKIHSFGIIANLNNKKENEYTGILYQPGDLDNSTFAF